MLAPNDLLNAAIMDLWRSRRWDTRAMAAKLMLPESVIANRLAAARDADPEIRMSARY